MALWRSHLQVKRTSLTIFRARSSSGSVSHLLAFLGSVLSAVVVWALASHSVLGWCPSRKDWTVCSYFMTTFAEEVEFGGWDDAQPNCLVVAIAASDDSLGTLLRCEFLLPDWNAEEMARRRKRNLGDSAMRLTTS